MVNKENKKKLNKVENCPICLKPYDKKRKPVVYHISYNPEKTITACNICNYIEYLSRKHPEKVPRYGRKFMKRMMRIQHLSPQYNYGYRQKFTIIKLDRNGNEISRDKEYLIMDVKESSSIKRRYKIK